MNGFELLGYLLPYISLSLGAVLLFFLSMTRNQSFLHRGDCFLIKTTTMVGAFVGVCFYWSGPTYDTDSILFYDYLSKLFGVLLLIILGICVFLFRYSRNTLALNRLQTDSLLYISASGSLLMVNANHLVLYFVGLTALSVSVCFLIAQGRSKALSSEATFKYYVLGLVVVSFFLFGMALVWASTGTLLIQEIFEIFQTVLFSTLPKAFWLGLALIIGTLLFQMGIFPFHFWVPDVDQGSPALLNIWIHNALKISAVVFLIRWVLTLPNSSASVGMDHGSRWVLTLGVFSVLSMFWGAIGCMYKNNIKRLLGYCSIYHMGFVVVLISTSIGKSYVEVVDVLYLYFFVYVMTMTVLLFILSEVEKSKGMQISSWKGMAQKSPGMSLMVALCLLSLAGLPPLGGFMAKFLLLYQVYAQGYSYLVMACLIASLFMLFGLGRVLAKIYFGHANSSQGISLPYVYRIALPVLLIIIFTVGVLPGTFQQIMEMLQ